MTPQGNLVLKYIIDIPKDMDATIRTHRLPPGHLKCMSFLGLTGGANVRTTSVRFPAGRRVQGMSAPLGGFTDWYVMWTAWNNRCFIALDIESTDSGIECQIAGNANADGNACQLAFWYEPDCEQPFRTNPEKPQAVNRG